MLVINITSLNSLSMNGVHWRGRESVGCQHSTRAYAYTACEVRNKIRNHINYVNTVQPRIHEMRGCYVLKYQFENVDT